MKISIIIPLYNKEHFVLGTIKSVIAQTFQDWEAIIINDGSTDDSATIARSVKDPRIRFYEQENQGLSATRNRAIHMANGEYIALLDADDTWDPDYLATMVRLTEDYPGHAIYATGQKNRPITTLPPGVSVIDNYLKYDEVYWVGSMIIKKSVYDEIGDFRVGVTPHEDTDMWLRMSCKYEAVFLNEELVDHPYETENNLAGMCDPKKSCPLWELYDYPYPDKKILYRRTTEQMTKWGNTLADHKYYRDAWTFLYKTRGFTTIRPRLKLLLRIIFRK